MQKELIGTFSRIPPGDTTEELPMGYITVSHRWIKDAITRRRTHGGFYKITSALDDSKAIYRAIRFSPRLKGSSKQKSGQVIIDWQGWIMLTGYRDKMPDEVKLTFKRVHWWQYPQIGLTHPDALYRFNSVVALISFYLGIVAIVISYVQSYVQS